MKTTITFSDFVNAFKKTRSDNFSHEGLRALFDYFEDYEESTGEEIELDVIAICCDYTEYDNIQEYNKNYEPVNSIDDIENFTTVIKINDCEGFIIQNY